MNSTALLLEDHKQILRMLNILGEMSERAQQGQQVNEKDVDDVLEFLGGFGDRHHQEKEESILFPALLRDQGQKNHRELCHLIFEHNRQRSLVEGLKDSMLTKKTKDFVYYASRLVDILRTHMQQEDDVLFPLVESTLSPFDDERVVKDMKAYDQSWQDKELSSLLLRLDNLESKYLGKTAAARA